MPSNCCSGSNCKARPAESPLPTNLEEIQSTTARGGDNNDEDPGFAAESSNTEQDAAESSIELTDHHDSGTQTASVANSPPTSHHRLHKELRPSSSSSSLTKNGNDHTLGPAESIGLEKSNYDIELASITPARCVNLAGTVSCSQAQPKLGVDQSLEDAETQVASSSRHTSRSGSTTLGPSLKDVSSVLVDKFKAEDFEKGSSTLQHVSLAIQGMTCTGCATKLARAISNSFPAVSNVRVNFVMGTAEFDVDTSQALASDIVREVQKTTSFNCTVITTVDHYLDIVAASSSAAEAIQGLGIPGVLEISILDKKLLRVGYDPRVVGARTLLQQIGDLTQGLAPSPDDSSLSTGRKRLHDMSTKTVLAVTFTIPILMLTWGSVRTNDPRTSIGIQFLLATFVQLIAVPEFYRPALSALWYSRIVEMDMLIVISITAAYLYSVVAFGFRLHGTPLKQAPEIFETSALLITLVVFSRLIVAYARLRAVSAVSTRSLQPVTAIVVTNDVDYETDARLLQFGDTFKVLPHFKIVTDGTIVQGSSYVNESIITGEEWPVLKHTGMDVIAGTLNGGGTLHVQPTRLPGQNTVAEIAAMVEQAAKSTPRIQSLADKVASRFVPIVSAIALIVFIVWIAVNKGRGEAKGDAVAHAVTYAIAVLAVSCPCGIGLAVPMVLVIAGGMAARRGVIIKSGNATERARNVTDVLFDKTGTLTETELDVVSAEFLIDRDEAVRITEMLVCGNKHPVSVAIARYLGVKQAPADETVRDRPGSGMEGVDKDGVTVWGGNPHFAGCNAHPTVKQLEQNKTTVFCVTKGNVPLAIFGLSTRLRPEATAVVNQLLNLGIGVHLVSGDHEEAVRGVAVSCGIPLMNVVAHCTPAMKRDYVEALQTFQPGRTVLFCGDGTNDAVAIAQADIGVQVSHGGELAKHGSEIARGAADVVLLSGLGGIPFLIGLSKVAFKRIAFNFVWSAVYNVIAILMAAGAFVPFRILPAYAGLGELVSILPVIFAAITMLAVNIQD